MSNSHLLKFIIPVLMLSLSGCGTKSGSETIENSGHFFWKQLSGIASEGGEMIYVAMFDEVDEGTAIFKVAQEVPVGESIFVPLDADTPTDHYLWLTGQAAGMLKQKQPLPADKPVQER